MIKPRFHSHVKEILGDDFSKLTSEIAPFVEPRMDLLSTNEYFLISIELAGANPNDISLKIDKNNLIIEGIIRDTSEAEGTNVIYRERFYGNFKKKIEIPSECITGELEAVFSRGILLIKIPSYNNKKYSETIELKTASKEKNDDIN
jgi:HSP20 family protein